ncbi:MAG: methyl-accepting chemotaxis protein [Treponema sp.]|jgi:methyl-accepting chemotaxis protein|nr:methyl-accepting chemotaxis protein [Treponema sp.]
MKLNVRLTLINTTVTIVLIAITATVILTRSSTLQREAAMENMNNLAASTAKDIQARTQNYDIVAKTLAQIMNNYQSVEESLRRSRYDETMRGLLQENDNFVGIYTVWRPNVIDQQGDYISHVTRESGQIELKPYSGYQEALASLSPEDTISNPIPRTIQGRETFVFDIRVPIILPNGSVIGLVGIEIDIDPLQPIVQNLRPYDTGHATVYAHDGTIVAHYNPAQRGTRFQQTSIGVLGQSGVDTVLASISSGKPATILSNNQILVSYPYYIGNVQTAWTVMILAPLATVLSPINALMRFAIFFLVGGGIAAAVVIFFTSNSLAKRIVRISERMEDIAEGEGDLTKRLTIYAKDEIGDMGRHFNETLDKISNLVVNIKRQSADLFDIGAELSANMADTAVTVNKIAANIQNVKHQASQQADSVSQTNATMLTITTSIEKLNRHIETQSLNISQSSSAIEELLANIASVTQTLIKNGENVKKLAQASDMGRTGLQEVSTDIQEIAKDSEGLLEITAVMENIASQTNLLSMNAAIEAAHAGESGKGFAVVADEIRKLAESSGEQSQTIANVLKKIKESIDKIANSTDAVIDRFEAIDKNVKTVSEQEDNVRYSMEEQSTGSQQILEYISKLNDITQIIKDDSGEMRIGSRTIMDESKNLETVTQGITNGMNEMASGADMISSAINRVSVISGENKRHIEVLVSEISKFKVAE